MRIYAWGFNALIEALEKSVTRSGGVIRTGCPASRIVIENGAVRGVVDDGELIECDAVISIAAPAVLDALTGGQLSIHDMLAGMFSPSNYPERSLNGSIVAGFECADAVLDGQQ